jgi:hypothetical protein
MICTGARNVMYCPVLVRKAAGGQMCIARKFLVVVQRTLTMSLTPLHGVRWHSHRLGFALGKHSSSILLADYRVLENQANAVP